MIHIGDIVAFRNQGQPVVSGYVVIDILDSSRCAIEEVTSRVMKASKVCSMSELEVLF